MAITFACEGCGKSFTVGDSMAGKKGQCKQCGELMRIPLSGDSDDLGLEMLASKSTAPPPPLSRTVYQPAPVPSQAERPKPKKKSTARSNALHGAGGYNGDHLSHLIWIGIVVAFVLFRIFVRTSVRNDLREAREQRQAQGEP
jgi:hypothetical protein